MTDKKLGLSSTQIKLIAAFLMTLRSLVSFGYDIPVVSRFSVELGRLGRASLPLFLYMLTESVHYTRSKPRFLLRLYAAAVGFGLFTTVTNVCTGSIFGIHGYYNVLFTYFYTVAYIMLIEKIVHGFSHRAWKDVALGMAGIGLTVLVHFFVALVQPIVGVTILGHDLFSSFFASPYYAQESPVVILLGVLMYFLREKWQKAFLITGAALLSSNRLLVQLCFSTPMSLFFGGPQRDMLFAVPIMLLYNGKRGSERKAFFYCYYPLHWYVIAIINSFWA